MLTLKGKIKYLVSSFVVDCSLDIVASVGAGDHLAGVGAIGLLPPGARGDCNSRSESSELSIFCQLLGRVSCNATNSVSKRVNEISRKRGISDQALIYVCLRKGSGCNAKSHGQSRS